MEKNIYLGSTKTKKAKKEKLLALTLCSVMYAKIYESISGPLDLGRTTICLMGESYVGPRRVFLFWHNK